MAFQIYQTVGFGSSKTGLIDVGYALYDVDGNAVGSRINTDVVEFGGGQYGALVTFPTSFRGRITWDSGEDPPALASASVNPEEAEDDDLILDKVNEISAAITSASGEGGQLLPPGSPLLGVVTAGVPTFDDCPVLTRLKAFIVDQGMTATLEHIMRDRSGRPVDLSSIFGSTGGSISSADTQGTVKLRIKEWLGAGINPAGNPIWEATGEAWLPLSGVVRVALDADVVAEAGIYQLAFGIFDSNDKLLLSNTALLSVERGLWADVGVIEKNLGPMTIQEIRIAFRDSGPAENLRLQDVEYGDEEIASCISRPVGYWNEIPPPIGVFTARNFPYRENWRNGVIAQLYLQAAHWYRRNKQKIVAGGIEDDDLNRDQEYERQGQMMWKEYMDWVQIKKLEINMRLCVGTVGSIYGSGS